MLKAFLALKFGFCREKLFSFSLTTCSFFSVCIQPSTNIFLSFFLTVALVTVWIHSQMRQCVLKAYTQLFAFSVAFWFFDSSLSPSNNCLTRFLVGKCSSLAGRRNIWKFFGEHYRQRERKKKCIKLFVFNKYFWFLCLAFSLLEHSLESGCNWEEVSFTLAQKLFCCSHIIMLHIHTGYFYNSKINTTHGSSNSGQAAATTRNINNL